MLVQEIADITDVTAETVRYYTRIGLLNPEQKAENGYREYDQQDLERLRFVRNARHLGFTVRDIKQILDHAELGNSPCPLVREIIQERVEELQHQIEREQKLLARMKTAMSAWKEMEDGVPDGHTVCSLIEKVSATSWKT